MELSEPAVVAKVRALSEDERTVYLEVPNGSIMTVRYPDRVTLGVGEVVLMHSDPVVLESAPRALWAGSRWIGTVRLRLEDVTIVDSSSGLRKIPTVDSPDYREGNTVEADEAAGVLRVLSISPIRLIDLDPLDEGIGETFRRSADEQELDYTDFGGLQDVVERARELVEVPLTRHEELSEIGARPIKGVMFTGRPGTGKTLLARIIASKAESDFYEISGPEIFSKWYSQSGEILRELFRDAASRDRAIIFFDEIDSVAGKRAAHGHEESKRVVAQLLTLMDGFKANEHVVVIAATNRPQDIDPALRRPGRFDWEIEFPMPQRDDRADILRVSIRKLATHGELPCAWVAERTDGWSAAELAAISSEAAILAASDQRREVHAEDYVGGFERVRRHRQRTNVSPAGEEPQ